MVSKHQFGILELTLCLAAQPRLLLTSFWWLPGSEAVAVSTLTATTCPWCKVPCKVLTSTGFTWLPPPIFLPSCTGNLSLDSATLLEHENTMH